MIRFLDDIFIPSEIQQHAEDIKHENYKVNKPSRAQVRHALTGYTNFTEHLRLIIDKMDGEPLDLVYFSCREGADVHTDELLKDKFHDKTWIIPVIVPPGPCVLWVDGEAKQVYRGGVYEFDHSKPHALFLSDKEHGCVVIMVAEKRNVDS